jgi:hypothetical protein
MSLFYTCETVPLKPTITYTVTVISINIFWGYLAIFFLYFGQLFLSFFTNIWFNNSSFLKKNMPLKLFLLTRNAFPAWDFIYDTTLLKVCQKLDPIPSRPLPLSSRNPVATLFRICTKSGVDFLPLLLCRHFLRLSKIGFVSVNPALEQSDTESFKVTFHYSKL